MTRYNAIAVSVQSAKPSYRYGTPTLLPLRSGAAEALVRVGLPADLPEDAVVTKADLVFLAGSDWTTSRTFSVQPLGTGFSTATTWSTSRTGVAAGTTPTTVSVGAGTNAKTAVIFNVAQHVQDWVSGSLVNRGWRLTSTTTSTTLRLRGNTAQVGAPYLDLEWVSPSAPPWNLAPAGTVAPTKPTLTFSTSPGTLGIQVQIAPDDTFAAVSWDSGEVVTGAGVLDLAATSYAGLAEGQVIYWRARSRTTYGWSDWSAPAEVTRRAYPALTITSPTGTAGDVTPPFTWTFSPQTAWRVLYYNQVTGALVADSGRQAGSATEWTPDKGLSKVGDVGRVEVRAWDNRVDRVVSTGDPGYAKVTETFTVVASGSAPGPTSLTVSTHPVLPLALVSWTFSTQPDEWIVTRNGRWVKRLDGAETSWTDPSAELNTPHTYKVIAVSNGVASNVGPTATATLRARGVWLIEPTTLAPVLLLSKGQDSQVMPEQAVVHDVVGRAPVRRRLGLLPPAGTAAGDLIDALNTTADTSYANLMDFKNNDAGHVYRLVLGNWNIPVTVGDITAAPTPQSATERAYVASFSWWQTDNELPWE